MKCFQPFLLVPLFCGACATVKPRPIPAVDIALGPVIVTFERDTTQLTSDSRENVARFANAYRELEPAFSGVTLCVGKGEGTLPERRARYVEKRLVGAGAKPVMFGDPEYCDRLGGREQGQIILLILPPES